MEAECLAQSSASWGTLPSPPQNPLKARGIEGTLTSDYGRGISSEWLDNPNGRRRPVYSGRGLEIPGQEGFPDREHEGPGKGRRPSGSREAAFNHFGYFHAGD